MGLIRRDLLGQESAQELLARFSVDELTGICGAAAEHFLNGAPPLGDATQSPQDYVEQVSATTGMPHVLVRRNMQKIAGMLAEMRSVLAGLTRNLDLKILDAGSGELNGQALSFFRADGRSASCCPAIRPAFIRSGFPHSR